MNFWKEFFTWLKEVVPSLIAFFTLGYKLGKKKEIALEKELTKKDLELAKKENKEILDKINKDLDSRSIINRAIEQSRKILRGDK